jgi:hypothetical protein
VPVDAKYEDVGSFQAEKGFLIVRSAKAGSGDQVLTTESIMLPVTHLDILHQPSRLSQRYSAMQLSRVVTFRGVKAATL